MKNDLTINQWMETINPKKNTIKAYLIAMQEYTEYTKKSPTELIDEAELEADNRVKMRNCKIWQYLIGFRIYLQNKGLAPITVRNYMTAVKSFYKSLFIQVPPLPRISKARTLKENNSIPSKEDLQEVLKICDPIEKAILLVGVSSGLSAHEVINLKVKDFTAGYDPKTEITTLSLRREKVGFDFITFFSPEASHAVLDYLEYRNRTVKTHNQRRTNQILKQLVTSDDNYLFISRQISDDWLETKNEEMRKLDSASLLTIYRRLSEKSRKNTPIGTYGLIRSHNMRKYFNSALLNANCDSFHVEFMMGHTLDDTKAAYFRANKDKLREVYQKFVPYLTIQKELDVSMSPDYQKIVEENQILRAETARHVVERQELQEFRNELEVIKVIMDKSHVLSEYTTKMELFKDNLPKNRKHSRDDN